MKYFNILLCCCGLSIFTYGQSDSPNYLPEQILIQTDRQLYVSGEIIWFKVFAFEVRKEQLSGFSQIAYVELINQDGISVSRLKIGLNTGQGSGTIELPVAMPSGNYRLRAYTQSMRNTDEENFATARLIVLNPKQALVQVDDQDDAQYDNFRPTQPVLTVNPTKYLNIALKETGMSIPQRSVATIEIEAKDVNGQAVEADLAISVAIKAPNAKGSVVFQKGDSTTKPTAPPAPTSINFFPAENRGMRLEGSVINEASGQGEAGVEVFLAFPGKTALLYTDLTDEDGNFSFVLPRLYGLRQVVVQAIASHDAPLKIELNDEFHATEAVNTQPFNLPPEWIPMANIALVNAQVEQAYEAFELPANFTTENRFAKIPFYGKANATYVLDDYTRFPLPEFYFEVVTEVMAKGKYGDERLKILNEWESAVETPPLLLVDGVPVFDQSTFLKINNKLISSTEVVTDPFWLNPRFYDGIVQIYSFEGDARCFALPESALRRSYLTLLPERQFSQPDYESTTESRLPDFRNTLYWNPSIKTNGDGKASISFFTSDAIGEYEVQVAGTTASGLVGTGIGKIQVVKEEN